LKEKNGMKKPMFPLYGGRLNQGTPGRLTDRFLGTVWMTDLKKAGERAEYFGSKKKKAKFGQAGIKWTNRLWSPLLW